MNITYRIVNVRTKDVVTQTSDQQEALRVLKQNDVDYHAEAWVYGKWHDIGGPLSLEGVTLI